MQGNAKKVLTLQKMKFCMETTIKKIKRRRRVSVKEITIKSLKKRGLLGVLKGKIHCDDSVFNLEL